MTDDDADAEHELAGEDPPLTKPGDCPKCGGAPERSAVGWVCGDCRAWLNTIDSTGIDVTDGGDG